MLVKAKDPDETLTPTITLTRTVTTMLMKVKDPDELIEKAKCGGPS